MEEKKSLMYKFGYLLGHVYNVVTNMVDTIFYWGCAGYGLCWGYKLEKMEEELFGEYQKDSPSSQVGAIEEWRKYK